MPQKSLIPDRKAAEALLAAAEEKNPGPWGAHSRNVALCAERIAAACGMEPGKAYVLGLLHDIGRRFGKGHLRHVYDGWKYLREIGYPEAAKICMTHSFCIQDPETFVGKRDLSPQEQEELFRWLRSCTYDDYDRLIQLCDALGAAEGIVRVEERMEDVRRRYGSYPQEKWDRNMELKRYFEHLCGRELYETVGLRADPPAGKTEQKEEPT